MDGLHTWVINLDKDVKRLQRVSQQLASTGLDWTRLAAVYGRDLPEADRLRLLDAPAYRRKHGMEPALGELGCYLSHVAVLRALLASPHRWALVLEDDFQTIRDSSSLKGAVIIGGDGVINPWGLI